MVNVGGWEAIQTGQRVVSLKNDQIVWGVNVPMSPYYNENMVSHYYCTPYQTPDTRERDERPLNTER